MTTTTETPTPATSPALTRIIELPLDGGTVLYVNPDHVTRVVPSGDSSSVLWLSDHSVAQVACSAEDAISEIMGLVAQPAPPAPDPEPE